MSNRVVTYIDINLNSVEEYWGELVIPNVKAFRSEPSPRSLFNAAHSAWHLHDWVWHDRYPGQDSRGTVFNSYRAGLLQACPELGWLRDIADAGKHRGLGRLPEVKGAEPHEQGSGSFLLLGIPTGYVLKFFLVFNDGSKEAVDIVLSRAISFWQRELKDKDLPAP
ncbi:hypothetical protein [Bradyrhizobium sp. DOA9]|uniref:hypothetical protein n=1 Tax=Bradyrhizobium sp. DOA9 TaxID=1126627 RepID=UPI00046904D5|nr:hypothetical protein [Bradyrhizobium sp. DOA9]GAJ35240.1 hypothetical protein BDOA9_0144410 [Bradyrhizobium sp. DOA9]